MASLSMRTFRSARSIPRATSPREARGADAWVLLPGSCAKGLARPWGPMELSRCPSNESVNYVRVDSGGEQWAVLSE